MSWRDRAACRGVAAVLFFPESSGGNRPWSEGRRICSSCPVRRECLEACLAEEVGAGGGRYGLRGGYTPDERVALVRSRRGRAAA